MISKWSQSCRSLTRATTPCEDLLKTNAGPAVVESMDRIDHGTVAKYLFTSGSTGMPKGVIQTQGMMCAVVAAQEALRTEASDPGEIPESLEWMPWNHISAGNITFNNALNAGGTIYLDAGKPLPGMFDETIRNLRDIQPLGFGSAPIAFGWLADAMERDPQLRDHFFAKMRLVGYGGATLSQDIYERFQALSIAATGQRIPLTTMYGATETQGITVVHWLTERVGLIGLPLPGITLKLVPNGTKLEVRVKGPTVTPGYLARPDLTEAAFDEDGFYSLGDAAKFIDDSDPEKGLVFDGRVTEDFKLDSGTWVSGRHLARASCCCRVAADLRLRGLRPGQGIRRTSRLAQHAGGDADERKDQHRRGVGRSQTARFHRREIRRAQQGTDGHLVAHQAGDPADRAALRRRPRDNRQGLRQSARHARTPQSAGRCALCGRAGGHRYPMSGRVFQR